MQAILPGLIAPGSYGPWHPTKGSLAAVQALAGAAPIVCLYGPSGTGKSHLLAHAAVRGVKIYDDLERLEVAAQAPLFHALQAALQGGARVAVASQRPVAQLNNLLPDVQSRLLLAPQLELTLPDDAELRALFAAWAVQRQLNLPGAVADFVLARAARNPATLHQLLLRLDSLSLTEKRAITVPLARQLLAETLET